MVGALPTGTKGFDCNVVLTAATARSFRARGYRFVVRYVPRVKRHVYDLTRGEVTAIMRAGLALMVVQHVALPGWRPDGKLGERYGQAAAREAKDIGYSLGGTLWCDLEEVAKTATRREVIEYCNCWYDEVEQAGYSPGLYVGYGAGLGAQDLYHALKFQRYWAAYNLNRDQYPAVRGVQLRQFASAGADRVPGVAFQFDVNLIGRDALGGTPKVMLAPGDR